MNMDNNSDDLKYKVNNIFTKIIEFIDDDNIITHAEFLEIQKLKGEYNLSGNDIVRYRKRDVERILYLQIYLMLLDDFFDKNEIREIEYYKQIFDYSEDDIIRIEYKVRGEKGISFGTISPVIRSSIINVSRSTRTISESVKRIVWERDGGKCVICNDNLNLEFDHDIPYSKGGSNEIENIRILCRGCNREKSANVGLI